jgi:hypothetical protein
MRNAHLLLKPLLYQPPPLHDADETPYTHINPSTHLLTRSIIDYIFISKSLVPCITSCDNDDASRQWTTNHDPRTNYHILLNLTLDTSTLWPSKPPDKGMPMMLEGSALPTAPNYRNLNSDTAQIIPTALRKASILPGGIGSIQRNPKILQKY